MKSEAKLRKSYETQKTLWEAARLQKIDNCKIEKKKLEDKISSLREQIKNLDKSQKVLEKKEFPSFESFRTTAESQREKSVPKETED